MIEHDHGLSARLQHPPDLVDRTLRVDRMVQHSVRVHEVERAVVEGQPFRVCFLDCRFESTDLEMASR